MQVDAPAHDPLCRASLLVSLEDGSLTSEPYPLTAFEPPPLAIDAATEAAMRVAGSDKEIKDPQDYVPAGQHHNLLVQPRCYYSTDASANREKEVLDGIKETKIELFDLERSRHSAGGNARTYSQEEHAKQHLAQMQAKLVPQSSELLADHVKVAFDPDARVWTVEATYTNPADAPISATAALPRTVGLRFVRSEVVQHGYEGTREFRTNDEAKKVFDELCASKTQGGSLQSVDRTAYSQTANVPALAPRQSGKRERAKFTALWVLACEDAEGKAHLLPQKQGEPRRLAYDFGVQPPLQLGSEPIPFELHIAEPEGTARLDKPSRAAAALDADRRGVPTWWVKPDEHARTDRAYKLTFTTPARHPPCIRFRLTNEGGDDDVDFPLEAMGTMSLAKSEGVTAKVLSYARAGGDWDCVARVQVRVPRTLCLRTTIRSVHELVIVCDLSGSMGCREGGSSHTRRELVVQELALLCEKLLKFPEAFKKAGIVGPDDAFELTIVGFHSSASFACERIPLERSRVEAAVASFRARTDTGGTIYASWAQLLNSTPRGEKVALCLLTDGALWDEGEFVHTYSALKAKVGDFAACAIGCGSWANHGTVKLVSTIENGEALITEVNAAVSSKSAQLLGKCLAATATKVPIAIDGRALSHTGMQALPEFATGPRGAETVYKAGLGATFECTVACKHDGARVLLPDLRIGGDCDNPERVVVQGTGARHDPADVLRNLDPLFVGTGTTVFKDEEGARRAALVGIGLACKTTTSEVTQVTKYDFDPQDDNSLGGHTRAVVPPFDPAWIGKGLEWLKPPPTASSADQLVRTEFEREGVHYCLTAPPYGFGSYGPDEDGPHYCGISSWCATTLSRGSDEPAFRSLASSDADPNPALRGLSASAAAPAPAPAPKVAKKAEADEAVDPNATPSFGIASKLLLDNRLVTFLNDATTAHCALQNVVDALTTMGKELWELKKAAVDGGDPMLDIIEATVASVSGPSCEQILSHLWPVLAVLCTFAMRFHVNVDLNLHNGPIADGDVSMAILRVEYLHRIAARVLQVALEYKRNLWRPVLTTKAVEDEGSGSKLCAAITWEKEDAVRSEIVRPASDHAAVVDAMQKAAHDLQLNFDNGGHSGGRWASPDLIEGRKPPEFCAFDVKLPNKFVKGQYFDARANVFYPVWKAIGDLRVA